MSYIYDPMTGTSRWVPNTPFGAHTHDPSYGVYGSADGFREEDEVLRRQAAYEYQYNSRQLRELEAQRRRENMRYARNDHSPATIGLHRQEGNISQHFPARADSHSGLPIRNEQRYSALPGRRNEDLNTTGSRSYSRSRIIDSSADRETILDACIGTIGPAAYMERVFAQDDLRPPSSHPLIEGPALPLGGVDSSQDVLSKRLIRSLDKFYRGGLKEEPGHRFDNMDDTVVAAYINALCYPSHATQAILRVTGSEQPNLVFDSWVVRISFLRLEYSAVELLLPIQPDDITAVNNDILRVLHVHLSNGSRTIPRSVTNASVEESRRCVLSELERRGFTEKLPLVAALCGLNDRSVDGMPRGPDWSHDTASSSKLTERPVTPIIQISREVETSAASVTRASKGRSDNKARQRVRRGSVSITDHVFGEAFEKKKKGKAPVTGEYETDSDHSSAPSSSNTVQHELEVSSSEDSTPSVGGKATPAETTSYEDSDHSSETTKHKADKTSSRQRRSVSDQKSDY